MGIRHDKYKIIILPIAQEEFDNIYKYIYKELFATNAAINLKIKIQEKIKNLENNPRMYAKIKKKDNLDREYRKIIIKNYIALYTIDEERKTIYIAHCYYNARDYFNKI